jgi:hypothetical protein
MVLPTPYKMTTSLRLGGEQGSRVLLPIVPVHGTEVTTLKPPEPSEERKDVQTVGFPWPGEWTVLRDEGRQKSTVHWRGKDESTFPWGKETDFESLQYDVEDASPEKCAVKGEAESIFALKGRTLTWRGHLSVTTDEKNFYYRYTRDVLKDGKMVKTKTWEEAIPRDHQ